MVRITIMKTITGIQANPSQELTVVLEDGTSFTLSMYFRPAISMWMCDILYGEIAINNMRVCNNLNILEQYSNILPFGIACFTDSGYEPSLIDDFSTLKAQLLLMTSSDVEAIEQSYKD